jgi:hypothetical protein
VRTGGRTGQLSELTRLAADCPNHRTLQRPKAPERDRTSARHSDKPGPHCRCAGKANIRCSAYFRTRAESPCISRSVLKHCCGFWRMWVTRIGALLYAAALLGVSSATPLKRPLSVPKNIRRAATSSDPSCPDGFFCQQQSCPDDVKCPNGEDCLNFEGNFACAPPGLKWCALNPTSLEAVGCGSGSCW